MINDFDSQQARGHLGAIAQTIVANRLSREGLNQTTALRWIEEALEAWKLEQAAPDGTIEVSRLSGGPLGIGLGDLADARNKRVPVAKLKPEQCGGPGIACAYDLLMRLYAEKYSGLKPASEKLDIDILAALLVQRDFRTMPLSSLAFATRHFWTIADLMGQISLRGIIGFGDTLGKRDERETRRAKQLAAARSYAFLAKERNARLRGNIVESHGVKFFQANRRATNAQAAAFVHAQVKGYKEFRRATPASIERMLTGTKARALALLPRNSQ